MAARKLDSLGLVILSVLTAVAVHQRIQDKQEEIRQFRRYLSHFVRGTVVHSDLTQFLPIIRVKFFN